jgi:type IV pilus assembly protein PilX
MTAAASFRRIVRRPTAQRQRGIVMWVALGVLIVMSLVGVAMLRQIGGGVSIAGNVAFKQAATAAGDAGTEVGRAWYIGAASLDADVPAAGYSASWGAAADPTTFTGWAPALPADTAGNTVQYMVHRLCKLPGPIAAPGQECSSGSVRSASRGGASGGGFTTTTQPYFRVTSKVTGARNTVSYIQVVTD